MFNSRAKSLTRYSPLHVKGHFSLLLIKLEHNLLFAVQCYGYKSLHYSDRTRNFKFE